MSRSNRRWFRFSLKTLLILITGLSIYLGVFFKQARDRKAAIVAIDNLGGTYGYRLEGPKWLRNIVGDEKMFYNAARVSFGPGNFGYNPDHPFGNDELRDVIPHLNTFSRFRSLGLNSSQVTDAGLSHLAKLPYLERLRLSDTQITGEGLEHLMELKTLQYLDLQGSKVSSEDVLRLQQALSECEIRL